MISWRLPVMAVVLFLAHMSLLMAEDVVVNVLPPIPAIEELDTVTTDNNAVDTENVPDETAAAVRNEVEAQATHSDYISGKTVGRVNASNLNIRSGPSSDRYEIVTTLRRDAEVVIMGESGDWYSIAYPPHHPCYIMSSYVKDAVPGSISSEGVAVPVSGESVPLHVRPWPKATVVGTLSDGDIITILGRRGSFYTISPPPTARAWVAKKYVEINDSASDLPKADAPTPGVVYGLTAKKKKPEKVDKKEPEPSHRLFAEFMKKEAKVSPRRVVVPVQPRKEEIEDRMSEIEAELERIRQENERKKAEIVKELELARARAATTPEEMAVSSTLGTEIDSFPVEVKPENEVAAVTGQNRSGAVSGWIEFIGYGAKRPAAFRLVKGGEVMFLLRSGQYNLQKYINKRVEVDGEVETAAGFEANVLIVDKITVRDVSQLPNPVSAAIISDEDKGEVIAVTPSSNAGAISTVDDSAGTIIVADDDGNDDEEIITVRPSSTMDQPPVADDIPVLIDRENTEESMPAEEGAVKVITGTEDNTDYGTVLTDEKDVGTIISVEGE